MANYIDYQKLVALIYDTKNGQPSEIVIDGTKCIWSKVVLKRDIRGVPSEFLERDEPSVGYYGAVYGRSAYGDDGTMRITHDYVMVNRCMDAIEKQSGSVGVITVSNVNKQYDVALSLLNLAKSNLPSDAKLSIAGYSLGGSLSQILAGNIGCSGMAFDAYTMEELRDLEGAMTHVSTVV